MDGWWASTPLPVICRRDAGAVSPARAAGGRRRSAAFQPGGYLTVHLDFNGPIAVSGSEGAGERRAAWRAAYMAHQQRTQNVRDKKTEKAPSSTVTPSAG